MTNVIVGNFRKPPPESVELPEETKEFLRDVYLSAAMELEKLSGILQDNNPNEEIHLPLPPGIIYNGERGYHPDYSFQELWEITAGFQDPDPPSVHDMLLFLEGKIEL